MQHDPFSWSIEGGDFQYIPSLTKSALYMNETLNQWVNSLDDQKRELFVNTLFQIIQSTNAKTFYDLTEDWQKRAISVLDAIKGIDGETKMFIFRTIMALFTLAVMIIWKIRPDNPH